MQGCVQTMFAAEPWGLAGLMEATSTEVPFEERNLSFSALFKFTTISPHHVVPRADPLLQPPYPSPWLTEW